jgi:hypothetical protein
MEAFTSFKQFSTTLSSIINRSPSNLPYTGDLGCLLHDVSDYLNDPESLVHWSRTRDQSAFRQSLTDYRSSLEFNLTDLSNSCTQALVFTDVKLVSTYANESLLNPLRDCLELFKIEQTLMNWREFERQFENYLQAAAPKGFFKKLTSTIPEPVERAKKLIEQTGSLVVFAIEAHQTVDGLITAFTDWSEANSELLEEDVTEELMPSMPFADFSEIEVPKTVEEPPAKPIVALTREVVSNQEESDLETKESSRFSESVHFEALGENDEQSDNDVIMDSIIDGSSDMIMESNTEGGDDQSGHGVVVESIPASNEMKGFGNKDEKANSFNGEGISSEDPESPVENVPGDEVEEPLMKSESDDEKMTMKLKMFRKSQDQAK